MKNNTKPELLAPAGNLKKLKIAFTYGADAVYVGLPAFSLRAKTGFDIDSLKEGIEYAHSLGKKIYVTVNIFAHNSHLKNLPEYLDKLKSFPPDAIIASDPGVIRVIKNVFPEMEIHLSTQMNTLNYEAVKFWQEQGVTRVVLGRETSLADISEIKNSVPEVELEVFVHGAMCMSYSGRCYLSAWKNKRSANLGMCTQVCRWNYNVYLEDPRTPGEMIPVESDGEGTYIMNSKDLNLLAHLEQIIDAGVVSLKMEGRTKSIYYLAVAVRAYRQAIDLLYDDTIKNKDLKLEELKQELFKVDNRGYTTGFLLGNEASSREEFSTSHADCDWEFVGEVISTENLDDKLQRVKIFAHNEQQVGDQIEIVTPGEVYSVEFDTFYDEDNNQLSKLHGGTDKYYFVDISKNYNIPEKSLFRRKK